MKGSIYHAAGMAIALAVAPCAASAKDKVIAGIVFQQDQFFRTIQLGMEAAAKKTGAQLLEANSDGKPDKEQSLVNTFVSRKADAIVISPLSKTASASVLNRAAKAGVKVVTFNSTVEGNAPTSFTESSQKELGATTGTAAAKFIKAKLGGKANVAILQFKSQVPEQSAARINGFLDAAKAGADISVIADQDAWLAEKAVSVAADIITAHPEINIIFAGNEGGTVGAVQAVRKAGKQGKIFVFGTDGSEQLASFLLSDDNVLQAITAQQPFKIGFQSVETASDAIDGKSTNNSVVVPVLGLSRDNPEGVKAFEADLKSYK